MWRILRIGCFLGLPFVWVPPACPASFEQPRMAIIISDAGFQRDWARVQMSSHGWTGIANLAGIPYDTLFLRDIAASQALGRYRVLVFAQCFAVEDDLVASLTPSLDKYIQSGGSVIVDGPLAVEDEKGNKRSSGGLDALLGLEYEGIRGDTWFRIRMSGNDHFITRMLDYGQFVTQPLAGGLNIVKFKQGGSTLLVTTDGKQSYPFLSCRQQGLGRIVLFSDLTTSAGATSFFRNGENDPSAGATPNEQQPQVFYANRLVRAATRAVYWAVYGDPGVAFPAPQVSDANLTAIVRLDADNSLNLDYQIKTLDFLIKTAKETGVVPIYAWVSSGATKAGWDSLAHLGKQIEELGGKIGTHSKYHRIRGGMPEERWREELDGSLDEIASNLGQRGVPIGRTEWFINPGDTIHMNDYEKLASRFALAMTHGFEQDTPVGYGVMTWYSGPHKDLVVVDNSPSPDYQWFYDPDWSYTTAQITAYEEAIFDHMFRNIGAGVIFNEMWHDYSMSSMPVGGRRRSAGTPGAVVKPDRIKNTYNLPFYEALRSKFSTYSIYCPEPADLRHKLLAMAQWDYSWKSDGKTIEMNLDSAGLRLADTVHYTGGMGIRLENTTDKIQSVSINGQPHFAFDDHLVILPNLNKGVNRIVITLGPNGSQSAHLVYVSKRMPSIREQGDSLEVNIVAKTKARFAFYLNEPGVLLDADWQEWNRKGDHRLDGYVTSDRSLVLKRAKRTGFSIASSTVRISDFKEGPSAVTLLLENSGGNGAVLRFRSQRLAKEAWLGEKSLNLARHASESEVTLPAFDGRAELKIAF